MPYFALFFGTVEGWTDLHLRPRAGAKLDLTKEAVIFTTKGKAFPIYVEGIAHVQPTLESIQEGIWRAGDILVTVSGVTPEQLQTGDLLVQESDARQRVERRRRST